MNDVRHRTLPTPASGGEFAYRPVLDTFGELAASLIEEARAENPSLTRITELAEDLSRTSDRLRPRWERLEPGSPYRVAGLEIPIELLEEIVDFAQENPDLAEVMDVDAELADLLSLRTRLVVGVELEKALDKKKLSIRGLAKQHGFSAGHLSDIRNSRSGLPTEEVCNKLDAALGTKLKMHVKAFAIKAEELRTRSGQRRKRRRITTRRAVGLPPGDNAKLRVISAALVEDRAFLDLVESLTALSTSARRGIHALIRELLEG